jgi:hypothetical protein
MSFWTIPAERELISHFTNGDNASPYEEEMIKKSVELISNAYGEVHLITDTEGAKKYSFVEWGTVDTSLNSLPKEYCETWSLGKIKAYNIIARRGESFLHFDHDFFINQRLPKDIEEKSIIFQCLEPAHPNRNYNTAAFKKYCPFKHITHVDEIIYFDDFKNSKTSFTNIFPTHAFNCGIVGGSDLDFFYDYSESALKTVLDPFNAPFWTINYKISKSRYSANIKSWTKAILAEQYYAAMISNLQNKEPYFISSPNKYETEVPPRIHEWLDASKKGFKWLHLYGHYKLHFNQIFEHNVYHHDEPFRGTALENVYNGDKHFEGTALDNFYSKNK